MGTRSRPCQSKAFQANGLLPNETTSVIQPIDLERWAKAEEQTEELISCIQPNWSSEKHRNAVASYVQHLITKCVPCQVFTFGSVPLKTYLPDGDIDLTVFSEDQNLKDNWANEVRDMLEKEEKNEHAAFQVKEVQYIQAEVRIIKCLVDNIVVDISFNQLGGLCTLCFLEEVDNLISQNHLFKRSIILIKAWCYYESRILGAHHGLISTYALETLVLYTFNVFNNSFAGPLEVLYHFLEFFSKFDWANFCVSLWGPVPINSLPNMTANPPRKDGGDLLLNRMFLSACSTAYSVFPGGQETQEQPFITKHFNVIDPLRINNNLGRSVSKGNFYRIRSAFSFGAQQLARILECQQENIEGAVNQFFVNTWDRHGKRCRPDAHIVDAFYFRQVESEHGGNLGKNTSGKKPMENFISHVPKIDQSDSYLDSSDPRGIFLVNNVAKTADALRDVHAPKLKDYDDSTSDLYSQRHDLTKMPPEDREENCRKNILPNKGRSKHQLARTYSSPELTCMPNEASSAEYMSNVTQEKMEKDTSSVSNYTRRTRTSGIFEDRVVKDATNRTMRESSKGQETTFNTNNFRIYAGDSVVGTMPPVYPSESDSSQTQQEEQEVMNLMLPSGIQNYGRHVHMPVNLSSHQLVQIPPSVLGYNHQIFAGTVPAYSIGSDWNSVMRRSDGPPFPQHFNTVGVPPDQAAADLMGQLNGNAALAEVGHQDDDRGFWIDSNNVDSIKEIDPANEVFSNASSRLSPASPATSSRTKASSESSWDGKPAKMTTAVKHPLGKTTRGLHNDIASDNSEWQGDQECVDQNYSDVDDDRKDWVHLSTAESVASSVTSSHVEVQQLPGLGSVQMSYPASVLPFAPMLVRPGSQQGLTNNHGMVAFYPAGPPVPFVTMMPFVTIRAERGTLGAHASQHDMEIAKPTFPMLQSGCSSDSAKDLEQFSDTDNYHSEETTATREPSGEGGSDIFNSDFASHWKNLQYGRFCQISQLQHHFLYPPSVVVSPQHLQGELHFNGQKKPSSRSANVFAQVAPISAQRGSSKPAGVSRRYGGDVPKNRNGTGTYFPNTKILRDRQLSTPRQYRGDYNYDRNEHHGDRETNWNFSKPRSTGRDQARYSYEKPNTFLQNSGRSYRSSNDALPLVMLYPCDQTISYIPRTEQLPSGTAGPEHFVGTNGQERSGYWRRGDHQLPNYHGDSEPPSPDYASPPRFPGADSV